MTALLLNSSRVYFEMDLGLLILGGIFALGALALMLKMGYRLGRKAAPARALHIQGGLEGQCAAKDRVIEQQFGLLSRQAEKIGSARGARKHLRAAGI